MKIGSKKALALIAPEKVKLQILSATDTQPQMEKWENRGNIGQRERAVKPPSQIKAG